MNSGPNDEKSESKGYDIDFEGQNKDFQLIFTPLYDFQDFEILGSLVGNKSTN